MGDESNNSSPAETTDSTSPDVKEVSSVSREGMDASAVCVREEVQSDESCESNESSPNCKNDTHPEPCREDEGDSVAPFCFVAIKMEEPDESDESCASSERTSFTQEYPSNPEEDCYTVGSGLHEKSSVKPNSPSSNIEIKREREESIECGKSGSQINDGISDSEDVNSELDSNSVVNRDDDMGHSSHEFIRGIEYKQFPILWQKQEEEEKTEAQYVVKRNKTVASRGAVAVAASSSIVGESQSPLQFGICAERPFECRFCKASFGARDVLRAHVQATHAGKAKPFECAACGAAFARLCYLMNHRRVHTADKPFHCDACGATFRERCHLVTHRRIHAPRWRQEKDKEENTGLSGQGPSTVEDTKHNNNK